MAGPISLVEQAEVTLDDAAAFQIFLESVPQPTSAEIEACMWALVDIANALRTVDEDLSAEFVNSSQVPGRLHADISLLLRSLVRTHESIDVMFHQTRLRTLSGRPPYRLLWDELETRLRTEGCAMYSRLEMYSSFLCAIRDGVRRMWTSPELMYSMRSRLTVLLDSQEQMAAVYDYRVPLPGQSSEPNDAAPPEVDSFAAAWQPQRPLPMPGRPPTPHFPFPAPFPHVPAPHVEAHFPPQTPEAEVSSALSSASEQTWSSLSSRSPPPNDEPDHWATRVFHTWQPSSLFRTQGPPTRCHGRPDYAAREMLRTDGFVEVLRFQLPDTYIYCRFFWRDGDQRAKVLLTRRDSQRRIVHYSMPMTSLKIVRRQGGCVHLNRYDEAQHRHSVWANLRFTSYEEQVLFASTFMAMKRQDRMPSLNQLREEVVPGLTGELFLFSVQIVDGRYLHALRMFLCEETRAVRLVASPLRGPMTHTPLWTAFITEQVGNARWIRRVSRQVIELASLRPVIFCEAYYPPQVAGRFRLTFATEQDADVFTHHFEGLADEQQ